MRTSMAAFVAVGLLGLAACNKAERRYPTISARSPDGGGVNVHGSYNRCPQVIYVATPDHVAVGRPISLMAIATDADDHALTYAWTATSGSFASASAPMTTFECARNGAVTITLTVSDGSCPSATSGVVLCQPGDGGVPDGGADAAATGAGGTSGGQAGATGAAGMGGATGAAGAGGGSGAAGQAGVGGRAGAAGGTAGGTGSGGAGPGATCFETEPSAEIATMCSDCLATNKNPDTDGCCEITDPVGIDLCRRVAACMRSGGSTAVTCNVGGDVTSCFCGTATTTTCGTSGAANGPCVAAFTAAAARNVVMRMTDVPTAEQVLARQADPAYALGRAANIHGIAALFCPVECGF
jgi:hypothetical protein